MPRPRRRFQHIVGPNALGLSLGVDPHDGADTHEFAWVRPSNSRNVRQKLADDAAWAALGEAWAAKQTGQTLLRRREALVEYAARSTMRCSPGRSLQMVRFWGRYI